jgi:hypothetical protein
MAMHPNILNELKEISPMLLNEAFNNPTFRVPDGYFETLPHSLLNLTLQNAPEIPGTTSYTVPTGYFEHFAKNMLDQVQALELVEEELEFVSPILQEARLHNPYQVPVGYFEELPNKLLQQQSAKVIRIHIQQSWMRYAAAAIVTGCIFVAGWMYRNTPIDSTESTAPLAAISIPKQITETELQQFLDKDVAATVLLDTVTVTASTPNTTTWEAESMKEMLSDVSDEELANYTANHVASTSTFTNE